MAKNDKLKELQVTLKFTPTDNNFTVDDINNYKAHRTELTNQNIIDTINDMIISKINKGEDSDGITREYIHLDFKIPTTVEEHFKHRGFRVDINSTSHEEEIYSGGLRPDYIEVTEYTTVIAWDKL